MKKTVIMAVLLLSSSFLLKAQDNIKPKAQPDSIIKIIPVDEGRHTGYLYTIGGKLQTREDVAIRLMAFAPSAAEYSRATNNITWFYVSDAGGAASSIAAIIEYVNNNKNAGATTGFVNGEPAIIYQHHNLAGAYIFTGLAAAFAISSIVTITKAALHSNKAIKLYNQRFE